MLNFLTRFYEDTYVPHVKHVVYPCLMAAVGWKCIKDYGWVEFGLFLVWSAGGLMFVILLGIGWRGPIEYWEKISESVRALLKAGVQPLEIKKILGLSSDIPETVTVKEYTEPKTANSLPGIHYTKVPINDMEVMRTVANKVILSQSTDFTEQLYSHVVKNGYKGGWAKFQKDFKSKGYITKASKHPKSKHVLTRKGLTFMYEIADQTIIKQVRSNEK